ncbi:hypothetical protein RF11_05738 [Thelohanellus kitauei]|uniref:Uncharacterized protein n=1 Tax=Thelohanellus kitauei TaxID=669202 RepID=A0A0C2JXP3_THEKT|nr:hypothetical protein RF11_05738 [Thelohanellus kitauei]
MDEGINVEDAVFDFLLSYRTMPFKGGISPSEMMHGRQMKCQVVAILTGPQEHFTSISWFKQNQSVWVPNHGKNTRWLKGEVIKPHRNMLYLVKTEDGQTFRHRNQLKPRYSFGEYTD